MCWGDLGCCFDLKNIWNTLISIMHLFSTWNSSKTSNRFKKPGQQSTEDSSVLIPWASPISHDLNAVSRTLLVPDSCAQACVTGPDPGDPGLGWKTDGRLGTLWTREGTRGNRTRPVWPFTLDSGQRFDGHLGEVNDTTNYTNNPTRKKLVTEKSWAVLSGLPGENHKNNMLHYTITEV